MQYLTNSDKQIAQLLQSELDRQRYGLEMIPSENFVSEAVLDALGSCLTNKYSEGYPNKRYYGGNEFIDEIENLAINRARKLFNVDHVNVQTYSGSPANQAAIFAIAQPGDKIMGLHLFSGGHLTHGWKVNFSARYYNSVSYKTDTDGFINYDNLYELVQKEKPRVLFSGSTAYPRRYDYKKLAEIAHSVDAYYIAAGIFDTPVGFADIITTTTHKTLRGPRGGMIMCNGKPSKPLRAIEISRKNLPTLVDRAVFPGLQGGPHNHTTAAIAVALGEALKPEYITYMKQVGKNAKALADALLANDFKLATGGTDNHLLVIDLTTKKLTGKQGEDLLSDVQITCNKNTVPNDTRKPFDPSGIRLGTPALTSRGFLEEDFTIIGNLIANTLNNPNDNNNNIKTKNSIKELTDKYPLYPNL